MAPSDLASGWVLSGDSRSHRALLADRPDLLRALAHPLAWRILTELSRAPDYPGHLAERLKVPEPNVYYFVHRLRAAGLLVTVREERARGARRIVLAPAADAFAAVLPGTGEAASRATRPTDPVLRRFLDDFAADGTLDAAVVLGAPGPHGPFLTAARDGPYAVPLALFLGGLYAPRPSASFLLDTEVRALGHERESMIVVGGPVANIVTLDLNPALAVRFDWSNAWRLRSERTGRTYGEEDVGLVAKIRHPSAEGKWVLLLAGLHTVGTLASIRALTHHAGPLLDGYAEGEWYRVVRGVDRDGDGRIDDVTVLE